jgi:hypothetical protein
MYFIWKSYSQCNLALFSVIPRFIHFQILMNVISGMDHLVVVVPMLNAQTLLEALDASANQDFREMPTSNV